MARLAQLEVPRGWYHVINRGHQLRARYYCLSTVKCCPLVACSGNFLTNRNSENGSAL
jgi:hypothetical protein